MMAMVGDSGSQVNALPCAHHCPTICHAARGGIGGSVRDFGERRQPPPWLALSKNGRKARRLIRLQSAASETIRSSQNGVKDLQEGGLLRHSRKQ